MVNLADVPILKGIPEFFESDIGECLAARTECLATFRELGPPDLCHIIKSNPKSQIKEAGTYHYVLGVDASSSATLAAYLNSLTYTIEQSQAWSGKAAWKIKSGTYCSFNAFSRVDVRVEVRIPGGVDCYVVDLRGERHPISNPAIWSETAVSAVLRAFLDDNDEPDGNDGQPLLGLRKLDILPTLQSEKRFLETASLEFWKGWQLGTDAEVQVATYFSNHLSNGILKYFGEGFRLMEAANFFTPLFERDPEVGAVLAKAYLGCDEEIKAVNVLYDALKRKPLSYGLLLVQIDFLLSKKKLDMALKLAKLAVTYAPSEYSTWAKLTEVYIQMEDYNSALLSLNSCPMFTYCEKDAHRMPPPARTHLPLKVESLKDEDLKKGPPGSGSIEDENDPRENEIHPELQRLPALSLRGTFLRAYGILTKICNKVGWDELLKHRTEVFVMEEEYRIHRALVEEKEKGYVESESDEDELDEQPYAPPLEDEKSEHDIDEPARAAIKNEEGAIELEDGINDLSLRVFGQDESSDDEKDELPHAPPLPNDRRRSGDSTRSGGIAASSVMNEDNDLESVDRTSFDSNRSSPKKSMSSKKLSIDQLIRKIGDSSETQPQKTLQNGDQHGRSREPSASRTRAPNPRMAKHSVSFSFKSKRLCEKWLDNLFMVLYNDLRLYTALKQEITHYKSNAGNNLSEALLYRKTGSEWEVFGDLALRLNHVEDAIEAFSLATVQKKASVKGWLKLIEIQSIQGNINKTLAAVDGVVDILDKAYIETTFPSPIARGLFRLVKRHGLAKVQNALLAIKMPQKKFRVISRFFEYAELFKVKGAQW